MRLQMYLIYRKVYLKLFIIKNPTDKVGFWGGRPGSNRRPPEPQSGALTS